MLHLKGIEKSFKDKVVLAGVDLNIGKNQIYGLVGSNGSGKTTVMKIISGLLKQNSGEVILFGKSGKDLVLARKDLGILIENPALNLERTAYDNLEYYFYAFGIKPSKIKIDEYLELVNLNDVDKKKVGELSLGMKQRLGIAIALVNNAKLLLLDEPTNGLDPIGIIETRNSILKIVKERDMSILISSHILSELEQLADCFGFLHNGKIISEISSKEIHNNLNSSFYIKVQDEQGLKNILNKMNLSLNINYSFDNYYFIISTKFININSLFKELVCNNILVIDFYISRTSLEAYYISVIKGG